MLYLTKASKARAACSESSRDTIANNALLDFPHTTASVEVSRSTSNGSASELSKLPDPAAADPKIDKLGKPVGELILSPKVTTAFRPGGEVDRTEFQGEPAGSDTNSWVGA